MMDDEDVDEHDGDENDDGDDDDGSGRGRRYVGAPWDDAPTPICIV